MNIMRISREVYNITNVPNRCLVVEKLTPTDESVRDDNPVRFISHQRSAPWSWIGRSVARLRVLLSKAWHGTGYGHDLRAA